MKLARALLRAVDAELAFIRKRGGSHVHVDAQHDGPQTLVATVRSSLDGAIEVRRFVCWERDANELPKKRILWARPETVIVARVA